MRGTYKETGYQPIRPQPQRVAALTWFESKQLVTPRRHGSKAHEGEILDHSFNREARARGGTKSNGGRGILL
jgi:hypothetical protein